MARYSYDRNSAAVSINASNANGAGDEFGFVPWTYGELPYMFTWQILVSGGTYTSIQVDLQGSLDGNNWFQLDTSTQIAGEARFTVQKKARFVRANKITSVTATGTPVVTVQFST